MFSSKRYQQGYLPYRRHSAIDTLFENLRPAAEFLNIKQLSVPMNHAALMSRLHFNLRHFAWNYAAILFLLGMWSLNANRKLLTVTADDKLPICNRGSCGQLSAIRQIISSTS